MRNISIWSTLALVLSFFSLAAVAQAPVLTLGDSSLRVYMGGRVKITSLVSQKRTFPSGTAYLLLPQDATGQESSYDINARASNLWFSFDGPRLGNMKLGGMMLFYFTASVASEDYGVLPSLLYVDLSNEKWRFAVGQQVDVFASRVPEMVDNYFAMAVSGCAGNSSRGQVRAERFVKLGGGRLTITAALSEPITNYISGDLKNNNTDAGVPNIEAAIRYESAKDPESLLDHSKIELGVSAVNGTYRVFRNNANGTNIRVNKPKVKGIAGEYAFSLGRKFGVQGEVYTGQALGNYLGAIFQTTKGELDKEIRSTGWWVEGAYHWRKGLQSRFGYGQDLCNEDDLDGSGILKNQTVFMNAIWDVSRLLQLSIEPTWRKTSYVVLKKNEGFGAMLAVTLRF